MKINGPLPGVGRALIWLAGLLASAPIAEARVVFVNSSVRPLSDGLGWATAWTNVSQAVTAAAAGDEIWVAAGTYSNPRTLSLNSGVALYGGFSGTETSLDQRNWHLNPVLLAISAKASVVTIATGATNVRLDGFTIQAGSLGGAGISATRASAVIANNRIVGAVSGYQGVYFDNAAGLLISNNVIAGNGLSGTGSPVGGGGIYIRSQPVTNGNASVSIVNNVIAGNKGFGGGGLYCWGDILVAGNLIIGNESQVDGGGLVCFSGAPRLIGNRFLSNAVRQPKGGVVFYGGGGVSIADGASPTIANNLFLNNLAIGLSNNLAGGAIRCDPDCAPAILNNTLVNNQADGAGGAIYCLATNPAVMANNLVSGNSSGVVAATNVAFSHNCLFGNGASDLAGGASRDGNLFLDPRLAIDPGFGLAHILPDSPCLNAGDSSRALADWPDLYGQPRLQGAAVDIGAHESDGAARAWAPRVVRVKPGGDDALDGSSWALAKAGLQAAIDELRREGGEVWVSGGRYEQRIQADPMVYLYGGFAGAETARSQADPAKQETILDGRRGGSVAVFRGVGAFGLLDGFTIQNGQAENGGGILIDQCSPRITRNWIRQNQAIRGGGIMINGSSSPTIEANRIAQNVAFRTAAMSTLNSKGGGVYQQGSPVLPSSTLRNNLIADNRAEDPQLSRGGGVSLCGGSFTLVNNTIIRNVSLQNGTNGLPGNAYFEGCKATANGPAGLIANNLIGWSSSGLYDPGAPINDPFTVRNNCFFANGDYDFYGRTLPMGTNGNFHADPLLVETDGWPRLPAGSPCIDAGDSSVVDLAGADLLGGPRLAGLQVDIGAVELAAAPIRLQAPQWIAGSGFHFEVLGPDSQEIVILTSRNLQAWNPVSTNRCGPVLITNLPPNGTDPCFFRAMAH